MTRTTRRPPVHPGVPLLAIALATCAFVASLVPADATGAVTGRPNDSGTVCATVKRGLTPSLGTQSYRDSGSREVVTADVQGFHEKALGWHLTLRTLRRRERIVGLALCAGKRGVARLPLPADRRSRVVGASVNGNRVAWRTTSTRRRLGTLSIGTATNSVVRAVRSTTSRALLGSGSGSRSSGRLLVTPDGSATWSLPVGSRVGVWLWPDGERPRRIAFSDKTDYGGERGRDVRIVDPHHVLLGSNGELARYGPTTPGTCPVGIGVRSNTVGPLELRYSAGSSLDQFGDYEGWAHLLVCDPVVGDYVRVLSFRSHTSGIGSSGDISGYTWPTRAFYTAGTLVIETVRSETGGGSTDVKHEALIIPRDPGAPILRAPEGGVAGPGIDPPVNGPTVPESHASTVGARVVPGALAWVEAAVPYGTFTVHVSDGLGTRTVGVATQQIIGNADHPRYWANPGGLTLTTSEVTWQTPTGTGTAPITPTAESQWAGSVSLQGRAGSVARVH